MFEGMMTPTMLPVVPGALQGRSPGAGKVFFVGGSGADDDNEGTDPQQPLNKIATAQALCSDGGHDYIFVQDYWANDSFPVVVNIQCVHIIGLGNGSVVGTWPTMNAGAAACFSIGAAGGYGEIAGFSMGADGSNPCILVDTGANCRIHIHHCALGEHIAAQDGILSEASKEFNWSLVEHCLFGKELTRDGCRVYAPTWSYFNKNIFRRYGGIGINVTGMSSARLGGIFSNRFYKAQDATEGWAITITAAQRGMIDDNRAFEDGASPASNPYKDTSGTGTPNQLNAWGVNYRGNVVEYPA